MVTVLALYLMYMYRHTSIIEAFLISNKLDCKTDLVDVIYKIMYCNIMYHVSIELWNHEWKFAVRTQTVDVCYKVYPSHMKALDDVVLKVRPFLKAPFWKSSVKNLYRLKLVVTFMLLLL